MNTYTTNYWSLYLDFIEDFKEVIYRGYRLSYLVHFPSIIRPHGSLWKEIAQPDFTKRLTSRVTNRNQIQQLFSNYLDTIKVPFLSRKAPVAILDDPLIRIPMTIITKYFNRTHLITIKTYKYPQDKATKNQIYLQDYRTNTMQAKVKIQKQIDTILKRFSSHYVYQDLSVRHMLKHKIAFVINQIDMAEQLIKKISLSTIIISSPNHFGRVWHLLLPKRDSYHLYATRHSW